MLYLYIKYIQLNLYTNNIVQGIVCQLLLRTTICYRTELLIFNNTNVKYVNTM